MYAPNMLDVNELRRLLAMGAIPDDQAISGRMGPSSQPPQVNALARILSDQEQFAQGGGEGPLPMGSMRNEATGKVTYFKPGGGGFSDSPYPATGTGGGGSRPMRRVVGMGNDGSQRDLGEEAAGALPVDYTRPGIDLPGLGKARYTADGRFAVINNPDGTQTKVVLGYDAAASDKGRLRDLKMRGEELDNAMREEQIGALRERRQMLAAGPAATATDANAERSQKELEATYGKPDKGMRWTQNGAQEPLPGGEVERGAQTALEKAQDAIAQIDALKKHEGFTDAVGVSFKKALGAGFIPGTDTTNFNKRLEQLKGGAFLEAFNTLKGGGQITEVEGKKATQAITRMDTAQSEEEFLAAANDFRDVLARGVEKALKTGAKEKEGGTPNPKVKVGEIRRGYLYWGGDPSKPESWRKVR